MSSSEVEEIVPLIDENHEVTEPEDPILEIPQAQPEIDTTSIYLLYISHAFSTWGDRMWGYGTGLIFVFIWTETFLPAALFAVFGQLSALIGAPYIGRWIDDNERIKVVRISLIVQNASVVLSGVIQAVFTYYPGKTAPWHDAGFVIFFLLLLLFGGIGTIFSISSSVAVGKDWIVVLARQNSDALSAMNATMRRIDLTCKIAAPIFVSLLLWLFSAFEVVVILSSWNVISFFIEYGLLIKIYNKFEKELSSKKLRARGTETFVSVISDGWRAYGTHLVFWASLSYVLLYASVLSPGLILNSYLKIKGVSILIIGVLTSLGAAMGLLATFFVPPMIKRFGLPTSGMIGLLMQNSVLGVSVIIFYLFSISGDIQGVLVNIFFVLVVASRTGLWAFDLCETQILQEAIAEDERGRVNGVERSLINLATLIGFAVSAVFYRPEQFQGLLIFSYSCITIALGLYTYWFFTKRHQFLALKQLEKNSTNL